MKARLGDRTRTRGRPSSGRRKQRTPSSWRVSPRHVADVPWRSCCRRRSCAYSSQVCGGRLVVHCVCLMRRPEDFILAPAAEEAAAPRVPLSGVPPDARRSDRLLRPLLRHPLLCCLGPFRAALIVSPAQRPTKRYCIDGRGESGEGSGGLGEQGFVLAAVAAADAGRPESGRPGIIAKSLTRARFSLLSCPSLDAFLPAYLRAHLRSVHLGC